MRCTLTYEIQVVVGEAVILQIVVGEVVVLQLVVGEVVVLQLVVREIVVQQVVMLTYVPGSRDAPRRETNHRYFEFKRL